MGRFGCVLHLFAQAAGHGKAAGGDVGCFAHAQAESPNPRAVLGMLDVDGRELMRKLFGDEALPLTLPWPLFQRMEKEAADSVLRTPAFEKLRRG